MKNLFGIKILIGLLLVMLACVEKFEPDIQKFESVFVVDGELSNLPGPYKVKLSQSFEYGNRESELVSGARISIVDDLGNHELLVEYGRGIYLTNNPDFRGQPGRKYKLRIELADTAVLESEFEELKQPIEIQDIYWEYQDRDYMGVSGVELFIDTKDSLGNSKYYMWEYEEYWKFRVPLKSYNIYPDEYICWDSSMYHGIVLATTAGFSKDEIKRKSLLYIDNTTTRLSFRYSVLIRQYVLSERGYLFYKDLKLLNESSGSLFDPIPYSVEGNMKYLDHPQIPVLGLFQVAGVSKKRIYINKTELPSDFYTDDNFGYCETVVGEDPLEVDSLRILGYKIYDKEDQPPYWTYLVNREECFLCTLFGTKIPPGFWEE